MNKVISRYSNKELLLNNVLAEYQPAQHQFSSMVGSRYSLCWAEAEIRYKSFIEAIDEEYKLKRFLNMA